MFADLREDTARDMKDNNVLAEVSLQANAPGNLTPEQGRAVGTLGKDLCVSAGAGSGKTGVLVERFVGLVSEGGLSVSEILCITFTEKAAGEMKQRVAQKFKSLGMEQERQEVEFAYISTIDGFCSRLLRENALEAGLDPDFTILEEYEASSLQRDMAEELLAQWGETNPEGYKLLLEELYCRDLAESSIELLAKIRSSGLHPKDILVKDDVSPELTETLKGTNLCIKRIEDLLANSSPSSRQREKVEEVVVRLRHLKDVKAEDLQHAHIASLPEIKLTGTSSDLKENLKTLREDLLERLRHLYWEGVAIRTKLALREFLSQFLQLYQEEKRKRSVLDFSDLIERAINLLQTFPPLREEQRDKFRHILVDEFQDTNSLQKTLLEMLKGKDNLFVVGDAQQSIYGFRYADLEVFFEHRRQTQERGGEVIHLNRNFRSRPEVISFVNQAFRGYWGCRGTLQRAPTTDWRPLVAGSSFAQKGPPSVELLLASGEEGENMEEVRRVEARLLACRIKEIVENGELKITKPNYHRPITYGDFAILFRSTTDIKLFEVALEETGIPFFVVSGKGLYDAREIIDLINLLQLIDNPLDEVKLAAVLRSPFAGINDHTLFWMAHYAGDKGKEEPLLLQLDGLASIPEIDLIQKERLLRFRGLLERLRGLKERLSIASLMEGILAETQYDSRVLASPGGRQSYANLRKFVELTRDFEKREILGLPQFLRAIRDLRVTETRESEAPTDLEAGDVVKILTIHKAKGLEFPVVAVADMGRDQRSYPSDILFSKKGGLGLKIMNPLTNRPEVTATFGEIEQEIKEKEKGEEERVLYVALTRAQEHLILSGSYTKKTKSDPLKRLAETLDISLDSADLPDELTFGEEGYKLRLGTGKGVSRIDAPLSVRLSFEEREKILRGEPLPLPVIAGGEATPLPVTIPIPRQASQRDYIYSATEIMSYHRCPRLYYFRYKLGLPSLVVSEANLIESGELLLTDRTEDELEDSPWARLGTAAHRTLELYRPYVVGARHAVPPLPCGLEKAVLQALGETLPSAGSGPATPASQEQMDVLKGWVHNFYSSREGQAVMASKEVRHEMPFLFNCSGTPLRGKIDLLFSPEGRGWCLLDFKSSSNESGMLESYAIQMRLYSLAVRALFGTFPERSVLFFLPRGRAVDVDIGPEAMKGLDEWLKAFFDAEEKTPNGAIAFPARREVGCRWCEYGKYCV
ncbi:MAG: UvrD-helicase domain-containing protein [Planctomycetes bacterium]|nr:UvrD-helicase domain-containing protein [Planctomycetota bacterium]